VLIWIVQSQQGELKQTGARYYVHQVGHAPRVNTDELIPGVSNPKRLSAIFLEKIQTVGHNVSSLGNPLYLPSP
jgi:hypothetical protein